MNLTVITDKPHIAAAFERLKGVKLLGPEFVDFAVRHKDVQDIHGLRAMYQYDKAYDEVTTEERAFMKSMSFSEIYGMSNNPCWLDKAMREQQRARNLK